MTPLTDVKEVRRQGELRCCVFVERESERERVGAREREREREKIESEEREREHLKVVITACTSMRQRILKKCCQGLRGSRGSM